MNFIKRFYSFLGYGSMINKNQTILSQKDFNSICDRIMEEARVQATYNGEQFLGLTEQEFTDKLIQRLGTNWKVI